MNRQKLLISSLSFLFLGTFTFAQTSVNGIITDQQGNIPNAKVYIQNTKYETTSNLDGSFSFAEIPDGQYTLVVEYIGFDNITKNFTVENKQPVNIGIIQLLSAGKTKDIEGIVITSTYRASQARAITMKKNSETITEVLSADAIGKLPDRNAADAVQRMQGVSIERDMGEGRFVAVRGTPIQWTSSTLNGNRMPSASGDNAHRGIQFDIFPSELIQYVRLSKALTPDLDGDAIGGSVDFITRSSPNKEVLSASVGGGYVNMSQSPTYNASVVYGNKITDKLKFISSAVIWNRSSALDQVRGVYNFNLPNSIESYSLSQLQLRDYVADRRTLGFNLGMDYEFNKNNKIYFKGLYNQYLDQQTVRETYFNFDAKTVNLQARHADYLTDLFSFQLGGNHKFNKWELDWSASNSRSSFKFNSPDNLGKGERGYPIVNFVQPMTYGNLSAGRKYLSIDAPDGVGDSYDMILPHNESALDPSRLHLNQIILSQNKNNEADLRANFDFKYKVNEKLTFKFGSKFLNKEKEIKASQLVWMPKAALGIPGNSHTYMNQYQTEEFPYNGGFMNALNNPYNNVIINQITNWQIDQFYDPGVQNSLGLMQVQGNTTASNIASSYTGTENVWAAYAMATFKVFDKLQVLGGIRNEYNDITFKGKSVTSNSQGSQIEDIEESNTYNAFLPMVNMKWDILNNTILRAAYTRSFARPDFNYLNPGTIINDLNQTISQGNTGLNPTYSNNFDIMFEHYFGKLDMISGGVFYKSISDIIYQDQSTITHNGLPYTFTSPKNLEDATLFGVEIGISKRFEGLPGFLQNFGFEGNYSFIDSNMDMPIYEKGQQVATMKTTIPNQAKHIFNAILFYETTKFMGRIAGNYKGSYVSEIRSTAGPQHYQHFDKNFTVDFSASYSFNKRFRVFIELNNIFNEPNRYYHGISTRLENLSYSGIRGQLGLNFNL